MLQINCFIILFCVHSIRATNISLHILNNSDINDVSQCIVNIFAYNKFNKLTLALHENNIENKELYSTVMDVIVKNMMPIVIMTNDDYTKENNLSDNLNLVMILYNVNCESLMNVSHMNLDKNFKYIIILSDEVMLNCKDGVQEIAKIVATFDVTFMFKDLKEGTYEFATFMPFVDGTTCQMDNIKLVHLSNCINGTLDKTNVNVFPNKKPKDLMKCPLNVGIGTLYPYGGLTRNRSLPNLYPIEVGDGSDVLILQIVANYFNASVNFYNIKTDPENVRAEISFLSYILNGTLDVCAGGLYRVFGDIVSYSGVYSRQAVIWIFTVERENRSWQTFINKINGLYIFFIFFFLYSVVWRIFSQYDKQVTPFSNTLLYSWGALFGAASLQNAQTLKKKILNLFYLILCLHLTAYVSVQLYSFLTIQRPPYVYKDTEDISRSGKPLYMKNTAKYFLNDEKYLQFVNTSYDCSDFNDCIIKTIKYKGITAILDGIYAPIQKTTAEHDEARILKATEPVLVVYHEMLIRKESLLVGNFNKIIKRLFEAGICQKLYDDTIGTLDIGKAWRVNKNIMSNSYSCQVGCKISLSDCAGAFYVWILGCILSCSILFAEVLYSKTVMHNIM